MTVDVKEMNRELWQAKLDKLEFLTEEDKDLLYSIGLKYEGDVSFLYRLNECLVEGDNFLEDEGNEILFEREKEKYYLTYQKNDIVFSLQEIRAVVASMIAIFEEVLPLGSLVVLKKEYMKKAIAIDEIEEIRVVITHRYQFQKDATHYFPYAGVVYPTGMLGRQEVLNFTSALVENVIHKGFQDEQENAYNFLMKQELIIDKGMSSFAFANQEQLDKLSEQLKKEA